MRPSGVSNLNPLMYSPSRPTLGENRPSECADRVPPAVATLFVTIKYGAKTRPERRPQDFAPGGAATNRDLVRRGVKPNVSEAPQ